jgi:hydrogenase expression/formation protein HypC
MCLSVPGRIEEILDAGRCLALVCSLEGRQPVNLLWLVDKAHPIESWIGAWISFHGGFATEKIDEAAARDMSTLLLSCLP